ncbi:TrmH family RNA methyltransferase [Leptothoe sp. PORK10 BA2]|uniref:TrmH family RNA methyltransferase n=1 Tax=Leptothoe sp. PORK10 BA2 TaxID=3110254 RepID=UPI002B21EBEC|nr:RNA methyltransferase [Leptothoe sp. PORK10 BA2]MEA5465481.1 RNA methyltransferase [Leptothoe sp. PORK10 BA2]
MLDSPPGDLPCLTVCATLLEKAANQASLCRSCEVLGVDRLVLPRVDESWEFRKIAASAQQWQRVEYCPPDQLLQWLVQQTGYRIVALTVQATAQPLTDYAFAAKTLLLLGRELTGIPANILALCDGALTIPQYGRVESLNVQTAGAIAIYEYNRQWRSP